MSDIQKDGDTTSSCIGLLYSKGGTYVILYECVCQQTYKQVSSTAGTWIGIFVLLALYYLRADQTLEDPIALNMCTTCKVFKGI